MMAIRHESATVGVAKTWRQRGENVATYVRTYDTYVTPYPLARGDGFR